MFDISSTSGLQLLTNTKPEMNYDFKELGKYLGKIQDSDKQNSYGEYHDVYVTYDFQFTFYNKDTLKLKTIALFTKENYSNFIHCTRHSCPDYTYFRYIYFLTLKNNILDRALFNLFAESMHLPYLWERPIDEFYPAYTQLAQYIDPDDKPAYPKEHYYHGKDHIRKCMTSLYAFLQHSSNDSTTSRFTTLTNEELAAVLIFHDHSYQDIRDDGLNVAKACESLTRWQLNLRESAFPVMEKIIMDTKFPFDSHNVSLETQLIRDCDHSMILYHPTQYLPLLRKLILCELDTKLLSASAIKDCKLMLSDYMRKRVFYFPFFQNLYHQLNSNMEKHVNSYLYYLVNESIDRYTEKG